MEKPHRNEAGNIHMGNQGKASVAELRNSVSRFLKKSEAIFFFFFSQLQQNPSKDQQLDSRLTLVKALLELCYCRSCHAKNSSAASLKT